MPPPGVRLGITLGLAVELVKVLLFFEWQGKMDVALQACVYVLVGALTVCRKQWRFQAENYAIYLKWHGV